MIPYVLKFYEFPIKHFFYLNNKKLFQYDLNHKGWLK